MELTEVRRNFPSLSVTVLAVDSDIEHLMNLTTLLRFFNYQVATCQTASGALSLLRNPTNDFQILLADVALPDTDGFDLLTAAKSEFPALQVLLFSDDADDYETGAVRALKLGACAFYRKPIHSDILEHVWQHVFARKVESLAAAPQWQIVGPASKRKRDDEKGKEGKRFKNAAGSRKKPRVWSSDLHSVFVTAVESIGDNNHLTSGKILKVMEQMGVVSLSEPQVSSHLQQYRKTLLLEKKKSLSAAKETSPAQNQTTPSAAAAAATELSDQLPDITSADYNTCQQSTPNGGGGGGVVESEGEDSDWCIDLSFLEKESEFIADLLASI